jgi:hypothetical protein
MEITMKSRIHQISMLTLGILVDIKERISSIVQRRDGRAQPKIEEPDEENRGYGGILPGNEETPDTGADPDGELPSDKSHPDVSVPEGAEDQPSYTGESEEELPSDLTGGDRDAWQNELDPSTEEDIPLRPSEVEIPHEIQYDRDEDLRVETPGQEGDNSEFEKPNGGQDVDNPDEKEFEPGRLSKKSNKGKE